MTNLLYAYTSGTATLSSGNIVPISTIGRRTGSSLNLNGNGISVSNVGYYKVDCDFTFVPSASDTVTIQLYVDGVAVSGAKAVVTTDSTVTVPISAIVRKCCCYSTDIITAAITTGISTTTVSMTGNSFSVVKL